MFFVVKNQPKQENVKMEIPTFLASYSHGLRTPGENIAFTALHGRKFTPTPKFLGTAEACFVCHIGPNFQISLIYAFFGCP